MCLQIPKVWRWQAFLGCVFQSARFLLPWHWVRPGARSHQHLDLVFFIQKNIESNCRWCLLAFRQIKGQVFSDFTGHKRGHGVIRISRTIVSDDQEFSVSDKWSHQDFTSCGLLDIHSRILHVAFNISLGICHGDDGSE